MSSQETLLPTADEASAGTIVYSSGTTSWNLLDDNDDGTNHIRFDSDGSVSMDFGNMSGLPVTVNSVTLSVTYRTVGTDDGQKARMFVKVSGTPYYSGYLSLSQTSWGASVSYTWLKNPGSGEAWTTPDLNALVGGFELSSYLANSVEFSYLSATVDYFPGQATLKVTRHLASIDLWLKRRPESTARFVGNLDALNVDIFGYVSLEHIAGPSDSGEGWEAKPWQREEFIVHGHSTDLDNLTDTVDLHHHRRDMALVVFLANTSKKAGIIEDGVARFCVPSATFYFLRSSEATFTNALGESETSPVNVPCYADGLLILPSSGGRAADRAYFENNIDDGGRTWNAAQGTFFAEVRLEAVSGAANQTVAYVYHDASNWAWCYWDGPNARWVFEIRAAGTTYRATKSATPSAATWYWIGARWTGAEAELDATAYTASVWVDGVKGTDVVVGAAMTQAFTSSLEIGTKAAAGTDTLNGTIRNIHSLPIVYTDDEMGRLA